MKHFAGAIDGVAIWLNVYFDRYLNSVSRVLNELIWPCQEYNVCEQHLVFNGTTSANTIHIDIESIFVIYIAYLHML